MTLFILCCIVQAIDEQVERGGSDAADTGVIDTHAEVLLHMPLLLDFYFFLPPELFTQQANYMRNVTVFTQMCSPAQLRQQSEELYAVIDDVLARSTPIVSSDKSCQMSKSCLFIDLFSCIYVCFQLQTSRSQQSSRTSTPTLGLQVNHVSFTACDVLCCKKTPNPFSFFCNEITIEKYALVQS